LALYYDDTSEAEGIQPLQAFLRALLNLRSLELIHQSSPIGQLAAIGSLPPALTRLRLPDGPGTTYHEDLPLVVQCCPLIEELSVTIPRYRGGAPEVRLYRAIGKLPRLQRLELLLDASSTSPATRVFARTDHGVPAGDSYLDGTFIEGPSLLHGLPGRAVYNALIDSAVDGKLALAIFRAVSHGKKYARSSFSCVLPLETLRIRVTGGERIVYSWASPPTWGRPRHVLRSYVSEMGLTCRVDRDPRDDRRDVLHAVEVDRRTRDKTLQESSQRSSLVTPILRRIWPEKEKGSNWYEDWKSWPLESLGDEEEEEV
jgi:hypothetical protein